MMVSNWDWIDPENVFQEKSDGVGAPHFKMQRAYVEAGTGAGDLESGSGRDDLLFLRWLRLVFLIRLAFGVWRFAFVS